MLDLLILKMHSKVDLCKCLTWSNLSWFVVQNLQTGEFLAVVHILKCFYYTLAVNSSVCSSITQLHYFLLKHLHLYNEINTLICPFFICCLILPFQLVLRKRNLTFIVLISTSIVHCRTAQTPLHTGVEIFQSLFKCACISMKHTKSI